jgi:hypothetical protein
MRNRTINVPVTPLSLARLMLCYHFYIMLVLILVESLLTAATTYFVIQAAQNLTHPDILLLDLLWILAAQSGAYIIGAISWIYVERAGYLAYARYMLRFARDNRDETKSLGDKASRDRVEPFLTGETFYVYFVLLYGFDYNLRLLLGLIFNVIVLGTQIDILFPIAYLAAFFLLFVIQWIMRNPISRTYLENQTMANRMTAQGYTAWDNVFTGNLYNLRLWRVGFLHKLRDSLDAQIKAILTKEALSTASTTVGLLVVFGTMAWIAGHSVGKTETLIALIATLPRQIEMTTTLHQFTLGWNTLLADWTRLSGVAANMHPSSDPNFESRLKPEQLLLREGKTTHIVTSVHDATKFALSRPKGRINVRGVNGSGKSTLLVTLKAALKSKAYYLPSGDRLAFQFTLAKEKENQDDVHGMPKDSNFSSGERQLLVLKEIVHHTDAENYLLDEWDASLDPNNRTTADLLVEELALRARVIEISHRD